MKTKWALLVFFLSAAAFNAGAQDVSKCEGIFKTFESAVASGDYKDEAGLLPQLRKSCPKFNDKVYAYGELVLKYKIETAPADNVEKKAIEDLLELYSEYNKNFPGNTDAVEVKKAVLQYQRQLASEDEVYKILDGAFKKNKQVFTNHEALEVYFNLFLKKYEAGDKAITQEKFIENYGEISGQVETARNTIADKVAALETKKETLQLTFEEKQFLAMAGQSIDALSAVGENINIQSSKHFSCEKLELYYDKNYEAHKTNVAWLKALTTVLVNNKCYKAAVLKKGALALHELKPDTYSAYTLGTIHMRTQRPKDAIPYFEQAATLEGNNVKKSKLYYEIASVYRMSDKAQAKAYALKAADADPNSGRPYIFLAEMYTSVSKECGLNDFDRKALYWLATQTVNKAAVAEPKYKPTAEAMVKGYAQKLPTKKDVKAAGKSKGDVVTYGCWINETVTIPKL